MPQAWKSRAVPLAMLAGVGWTSIAFSTTSRVTSVALADTPPWLALTRQFLPGFSPLATFDEIRQSESGWMLHETERVMSTPTSGLSEKKPVALNSTG